MGSPPVTVVLAPALRQLFPEAGFEERVEAATVAAMLDALDARFPGMGDRLRDSSPAVRRNINIFVEGRRAELDAPLAPGSTVYVLTAISGG